MLENAMVTLKLAGPSKPFLTLAVPSSRIFGKKFGGDHQKAIEHIKGQADKWKSMKSSNFQILEDHVKIIGDGAFFSLNMQVVIIL